MLAKYTKQVVLTYDGDEAGQNATRRAIPMLEKAGVQVRVLRMQGAKDPDEFLKKYGADRFSQLLDRSENQAEYQLESLRRKFDLTDDAQRVEFLSKAAELISSFPNAVQREVYGARAAEAAGVTAETMKLEVTKAFKRRMARERKKQEKIDLAPAQQQQPKVRGIRYDNVRSAMAEEGLLRTVFKEPALLDEVTLDAQQFSSELLGAAYHAAQMRWTQGKPVSLAALEQEFSPEEMAHLSAVLAKDDCTVCEQALQDYIRIIREECAKRSGRSTMDALAAARDTYKDKKGYGGKRT